MNLGHVGDHCGGMIPASRELQPQEYRINLTLAVTDPQSLWAAAAAKLLVAPEMTLDDVLDVIGPREDPSIGDCIAAMVQPVAVAGCVIEDYGIDTQHDGRLFSESAGIVATFKPATSVTSRRAPRPRRAGPRLDLCLSPTLHSDAPVI
jgi:hypothetical protein